MAGYSFKLPDIGEGIAEAEIVAWHVAPGDFVEEDAPIADMMTDKATVEISSPVSGKIVEVAGAVGDQVAIGSVLAIFELDSANVVDDADVIATRSADPGASLPAVPERPALPERPTGEIDVKPEAEAETATANATQGGHRISASPAVRKRAKDLGIDLAAVAPAAGDRVRHADLDTFLSYHGAYRAPTSRRADEQVKVVGLRRRIAENMAASKRHIPHFSYVEEIDVTKLEAMREDLNGNRGDRPKLTMLPLLIIAICKSVVEFPELNARYDDEAGVITRSGSVHLGIATQTDAGLMVPVIRDAQDQNIWQLASEIRRLAEAARASKASSAELSGSTLTVTSLGPLGGVATTPVINRPEVAIIGPNGIIERPVYRGGAIEPAKLMNLSISCDHRVVDGWVAASFVQMMKRLLEAPATLFGT